MTNYLSHFLGGFILILILFCTGCTETQSQLANPSSRLDAFEPGFVEWLTQFPDDGSTHMYLPLNATSGFLAEWKKKGEERGYAEDVKTLWRNSPVFDSFFFTKTAAISVLMPEQAHEFLIPLLSSEDAVARRTAAAWLGRVKDARAVDALRLALLNDPDLCVRTFSIWSLEQVGTLRTTTIWNRNGDEVGSSLYSTGDGADALGSLLLSVSRADPDSGVRRIAADAYERVSRRISDRNADTSASDGHN
jgi:hypothetical protein